jgi:hypothetical protein
MLIAARNGAIDADNSSTVYVHMTCYVEIATSYSRTSGSEGSVLRLNPPQSDPAKHNR